MSIFKDTTSYMVSVDGHAGDETIKLKLKLSSGTREIDYSPTYLNSAYEMAANAFKDFKLEDTFKEHRFYFLRTLLERHFGQDNGAIIPFGWYEMETFIDNALDNRTGKDKSTTEYIRDLKAEFDTELSKTECFVYRINPTTREGIELVQIDLYNGMPQTFNVCKLRKLTGTDEDGIATRVDLSRILEKVPGWKRTRPGRKYAAHFQRYAPMMTTNPWDSYLRPLLICAVLLNDDTCIIEIDYDRYQGTRMDYYELMECHPLAFTEKLTATF